jgi:prepilin-type N-terminal cleavage/methylation domain-containing protein
LQIHEAESGLMGCRRAFTLIELLVVIAIIGVLMGVLLPSLGAARRQAKLVHEYAASRSLMQGYLGYAMDYKDALIPGHTDETLDVTDDLGNPVSPPEAVKRWPWRMVAYLNCGVRGSILVNEQAKELADRQAPLWSYMVSLTPSFGLNYFNLGGDLTSGGGNNAPGWLKKIDRAITPNRMIVFSSARSLGANGTVQGYFKIVPPTKAFEYSGNGWTLDGFQENGDPAAWGYVHPRWSDNAAIGFLDGHESPLSMNELRDMTRWSNEAAMSGNPDWRAP